MICIIDGESLLQLRLTFVEASSSTNSLILQDNREKVAHLRRSLCEDQEKRIETWINRRIVMNMCICIYATLSLLLHLNSHS